MNEIKELWARRHEPQGRIETTVFFVNIFLILCNIFFITMYAIIGHSVMIYLRLASILLYVYFIPRCYKNIEKYMGIAFFEMWIHLIFGILSFGWSPCYQNWCFAMIAAYFLPAFDSKNKSSIIKIIYYTFLIMFTYFSLATLFPIIHLKITIELDLFMCAILFLANNFFSFITIILFALFYTKNNNRKEIELSRKAEYDELTDLYNRHAINDLGTKLISEAKTATKPYHMAILDIDHFKKINDKYGHISGDLVLKRLSEIIRSYSVRGIIPGRWGGEEFVLMAPHYIKYSEFTRILENIRKMISEVNFEIENNKKIKLTVSIGSTTIKEYKKLEEAIADADINLYKAKETGRNKLVK